MAQIPDNACEYSQGWNDAAANDPVATVCSSDYLRGYLAYTQEQQQEQNQDKIDPYLADGVTVFLL